MTQRDVDDAELHLKELSERVATARDAIRTALQSLSSDPADLAYAMLSVEDTICDLVFDERQGWENAKTHAENVVSAQEWREERP